MWIKNTEVSSLGMGTYVIDYGNEYKIAEVEQCVDGGYIVLVSDNNRDEDLSDFVHERFLKLPERELF